MTLKTIFALRIQLNMLQISDESIFLTCNIQIQELEGRKKYDG